MPTVVQNEALLEEASTLLLSVLNYGHRGGGFSGIGPNVHESPALPQPISINGSTIIADQYSRGMEFFDERRAALDALQAAGAIRFTESAPTTSNLAHNCKYNIQVLNMDILRTTVAGMKAHAVQPIGNQAAINLLRPFLDLNVKDIAFPTGHSLHHDAKIYTATMPVLDSPAQGEKITRMEYLRDKGAITYEEANFSGKPGYGISILDMDTLTAAVTSYPYTNPKFPKPTVVQKESIELAPEKVAPASAAAAPAKK